MALAPDPCPANDGCKLVEGQRSVLSLLLRSDMFLPCPVKHAEASKMKQVRIRNMEGRKIKYIQAKRKDFFQLSFDDSSFFKPIINLQIPADIVRQRG